MVCVVDLCHGHRLSFVILEWFPFSRGQVLLNIGLSEGKQQADTVAIAKNVISGWLQRYHMEKARTVSGQLGLLVFSPTSS